MPPPLSAAGRGPAALLGAELGRGDLGPPQPEVTPGAAMMVMGPTLLWCSLHCHTIGQKLWQRAC